MFAILIWFQHKKMQSFITFLVQHEKVSTECLKVKNILAWNHDYIKPTLPIGVAGNRLPGRN